MKTKILKTIAAMLIIAAAGFSCAKDKSCSCGEGNGDSKPAMEGTKWKLAGIMDVEACDLKELEPKDCSTCYTLEFYTDSTAQGKSVMNSVYVSLTSKTIFGVMTEIYDSNNGDVQLLYDAMETIASYAVTKNELRFCYNERKNYLLYKPVLH